MAENPKNYPVELTYNNSTIGITEGQTAILRGNGYEMLTDVVGKVKRKECETVNVMYNGEQIGQITDGKTITLFCGGKEMTGDLSFQAFLDSNFSFSDGTFLISSDRCLFAVSDDSSPLSIVNPLNGALLSLESTGSKSYQYMFTGTPTLCSIEIEGKSDGPDVVASLSGADRTTQSINTEGLFVYDCDHHTGGTVVLNVTITFTNGYTTVSDSFLLETAVGCLIAGTLVLMADCTLKKIEDVAMGDTIYTINVDTNEEYIATVEDVYIENECNDIYNIMFNDGSVIGCTSLHKWQTQDGWKAIAPNTDGVGTLEANDEIMLRNGSFAAIASIEKNTEIQPVYHLYVSNAQAMFVTDDEHHALKISDTYQTDFALFNWNGGYD